MDMGRSLGDDLSARRAKIGTARGAGRAAVRINDRNPAIVTVASRSRTAPTSTRAVPRGRGPHPHAATTGRNHLLGPAQFRHHRPRGHRTRTTSASASNGPGPDQQPPQRLPRRTPKLPHRWCSLRPGGDPVISTPWLGASAAIWSSITALARSRSGTRPTPAPHQNPITPPDQ